MARSFYQLFALDKFMDKKVKKYGEAVVKIAVSRCLQYEDTVRMPAVYFHSVLKSVEAELRENCYQENLKIHEKQKSEINNIESGEEKGGRFELSSCMERTSL